jgi:hypothetical protein
MTSIHAAVIDLLRRALEGSTGSHAEDFQNLTEAQIIRLMFANFRGKGDLARGLRLTRYGLNMMKANFQSYVIKRPEGKILHPREIVYLDRKATFPYYCDNSCIVMFDTDLGFRIKLVDGDIALLMEAEED